ncbi:MAG: adenylate/guanylate cyclase domain-containing protein [Bradyrhizobium sp.]|nr:adenylate/guanylate cyclase domain-containing protein [Bradyrhizobium sp.]
MIRSKCFPIKQTARRKALFVLVTMVIFACLGFVTTLAAGRPLELGLSNAILIGFGVGLFEEFYVQSKRGRWLRNMHPLRSIPVYIGVIILFYIASAHLTRALLGRLDDLPTLYRRLPYGIAFFTIFSLVGVLMVRVIHFIGLENLFHLTVGTYHRPVRERKMLLFLDINGSTAMGERLGALSMRSLVSKFLSDLSAPITDHSGEIYLYKGDGLIAIWNWATGADQDNILRSVDSMFSAIERQRASYDKLFGVAPGFRIGIHGGDVIVSEQGDTKRSIGIYGDAINIAARMEEVARTHNARCIVSKVVVEALANRDRMREIGEETVKGISTSIRVYEYQPNLELRPMSA